MTPQQLSENDRKLLRAIGSRDRLGYPSNIMAVHFDGPELEFMISVHQELERIAAKQRQT